MSHLISNYHYRPEIDGLRAVAVLAVVFFHAGLGITGGYIGVDVFFVISGFLITSLILKDLESGEFTLVKFWERRARRIIPAMVVVVVSTLVAGWFLLLPIDYVNLGKSAAWQSIFGANFYFWLNTGYFSGSSEELPLLHTWSLAVEEQYYMVVPVLLLGMFRIPVLRNYKTMLLLFAVGIVISLAVSVYGVKYYSSATFYLLPTRAWELLCGAFVALLPNLWIPRSRLSRDILSILGIGLILVPCWLYTKATPFPGSAALLPCIGTGMFIWATTTGQHMDSHYVPIVARLLSLRPIVFIGLISYSLYLWHWPLIAFSNYWSLEPRLAVNSLAIIGVSFFLAVLTWRYVETPFRKKIVGVKSKTIILYTTTSIVTIFIFGALLASGHGYPSRFSVKAIEFANAKEDKFGIYELTATDIQEGKLINLGVSDDSDEVTLLLWGDSHAMAAAPAFDKLLKEKKLSGLQATASAAPPVLGAYWDNDYTTRENVTDFNNAVFDYIKQNHIRDVILVGYWEYYIDGRGRTPLSVALVDTVKKLVEEGVHPWIMLQVPHPTFDVPKGLAFSSIFNLNLTHLLSEDIPAGWNGLNDGGELFLRELKASGGRILDPRPCFIDSSSRTLLVEKYGRPLFRDIHHLSGAGAELVLSPCLRKTLELKAIQNSVDVTRVDESKRI